eukprot:Sspe_Gene.3802::Locus_1264_Transcript_1_1_Confidence_1.000_Length_1558::g.3802::m.3802
MSVLAMTYFTNSFDPRGMIRSTYSFMSIMALVSSRVVKSSTTSGGTPTSCRPSRMLLTICWQVRTASLPHLSSTPFPDLMAREAICTAASGRASKMMPSTPSGTCDALQGEPVSDLAVELDVADGVGEFDEILDTLDGAVELAPCEFQPGLKGRRHAGFRFRRIDTVQLVRLLDGLLVPNQTPRHSLQGLVSAAREKAGTAGWKPDGVALALLGRRGGRAEPNTPRRKNPQTSIQPHGEESGHGCGLGWGCRNEVQRLL